MVCQSLMIVATISTSGPMLLEGMIIIQIVKIIVHVLLVEDQQLLPLWELIITVNQQHCKHVRLFLILL